MPRLISVLILSKLLVLVAILFAGIGLMPDEAQYWTWSKSLSYCYYSKPCGIAWQIATGCFFFGDTELGVRALGLVLSLLISLGIYKLALSCDLEERQAFWAAVSLALCPLGMLSGFLATTDCAYVLFWTLAAWAFVSLRPYLMGVFIAVGALWKWPIFAIWIAVLLFRKFSFKQTLVALAISLLGLIPSLIWNIQKDFPTFKHVATSINIFEINKPNPLEFIGAQAVLLSPVLFLLLILAFVRFTNSDWRLRFCFWTSLLFVFCVLLISFFKRVQGNWAVGAYPTAFIIMALGSSVRWIKIGSFISLILVVCLFYFPNYPKNPLKQALGWNSISGILHTVGYDPERQFLFSDRYQWTSILSFYGPEQKRAYFFNTHGLRKNQFDYWTPAQRMWKGKNGWFVAFVETKDAIWATEAAKKALTPYFKKVIALSPKLLDGSSRSAILVFGMGYNGKTPEKTFHY